MSLFANRDDAGRRLAAALAEYGADRDPVVLAFPRAVPIAYQVATRLQIPMDVYQVNLLAVPGHPGLAMGAVASDTSYVVDQALIDDGVVTQSEYLHAMTREAAVLRAEENEIGDGRDFDLEGRTVLLIDDGLASGTDAYEAARALRTRRPARIVIAAPVVSHAALRLLETIADDVVFLEKPEPFHGVDAYYADLPPVGNAEVRAALELVEERLQRTTAEVPHPH